MQLRASTAPNANPARVLLVLVAIFGGVFCLLILVGLGSHQSQRASGALASHEASTPSIGTTNEGDTVRATKQDSHPPIAATAHDGDIVPATKTLFCGSTKDALDEMTKWAVRHDTNECVRVMIRTHSTLLKQGEMVKVLDRGFFTAKVRIISRGNECWIPSEAIR